MPAAEQRRRDLESQATVDEIARIRALWVRKLTLMMIGCSMRRIGDGGELDFENTEDDRRKGTVKLAQLRSPLDARLLPDAVHVEAHLLDLCTDAGATPVVRFFSNAGGNWQTIARDRE
jgi:hypothetical protein